MQQDKTQSAANSETVCHFVVSFSGTEHKSDRLCTCRSCDYAFKNAFCFHVLLLKNTTFGLFISRYFAPCPPLLTRAFFLTSDFSQLLPHSVHLSLPDTVAIFLEEVQAGPVCFLFVFLKYCFDSFSVLKCRFG